MNKSTGTRRRRLRLKGALRLSLLLLPALFWAAVFAALAGAEPVERAVGRLPDAAQVLVAVACPLLAVLLGLPAVGRGGHGDGGGFRSGRAAFAAGVSLFVLAVLAALGTA